MYNLVSFGGIFILILIAWGLSVDRKAVRWKIVVSGVLMQLFFGFLVFRFPPGRTVMLHLNNLVVKVLESASAGSEFLFGRLAVSPGATNADGEPSLGFILGHDLGKVLTQIGCESHIMILYPVIKFYRQG